MMYSLSRTYMYYIFSKKKIPKYSYLIPVFTESTNFLTFLTLALHPKYDAICNALGLSVLTRIDAQNPHFIFKP